MASIVARLHSFPNTLVTVVDTPDDICHPCPHLINGGCQQDGPTSEAKVKDKDQMVLARLGLPTGSKLSWAQLLMDVGRYFKAEDLEQLCCFCPWLSLGYCAEGLRGLSYSLP
ncbi:MAG: DUF1284 domain-containing protein [Chloroflexi bacterium]|nr:DUF1284 domain-containing protein [Chloroflexota bacterium]